MIVTVIGIMVAANVFSPRHAEMSKFSPGPQGAGMILSWWEKALSVRFGGRVGRGKKPADPRKFAPNASWPEPRRRGEGFAESPPVIFRSSQSLVQKRNTMI